jgi:sigma-B regulation protein RsbU (phosphoserine phosphatase)
MTDTRKTTATGRGAHESGTHRAGAASHGAAHGTHHAEFQPEGVSLTVAFVGSMGVAVTLAALIAGILNYIFASGAASEMLDVAGASAAVNAAAGTDVRWTAQGNSSTFRGSTIQPVMVEKRGMRQPGNLYRAYSRDGVKETPHDIIIEGGTREFQQQLMLSLAGSAVVVVVAGMGVAFLLSRRIVSPLAALIEDVRKISHGDLDHKVRVTSGGEVGSLAKSVDRMIRGLREAQGQAELAKMREHELAIASEVRASLLPERVPELPGYEVAAHLAAADSVGGDVYDYIENAGGTGRLSIFVAGISARGVPGAMLMTMARAYLHQSLQNEPSPAEALKLANRPITRDMRRGLFVTALVATLDPANGTVRVGCAGHKAPMLHYRAASQSTEWHHPEGIALGFDPGPVFDRTAREHEVSLAPGDRIVMTTAGTFSVRNAQGEELGEGGFEELVRKHAAKTSEAFCQLIGSEVERFRGDTELEHDVIIVTIRRRGKPGGAA